MRSQREALHIFPCVTAGERIKGAILFCEREWPPLPLPPAGGIFFLAKRQELLYAYMHNVKPYG